MKKTQLVLTPILILAAVSAMSAQTVTVNPTSLAFSALVGGSVQNGQLAVSTSTGAPAIASSNASWLKINASGSLEIATPATLTITADPTGLAANNYSGTIALNAVGSNGVLGPTLNVTVTFAVGTIGVSQTSVSFSYQTAGSVPQPANLTLTASQTTAYTVTTGSGCGWLTVPAGGNAPGTLTLTPNASALPAPGTYPCTVTLSPSNAPPVPITATLTVTPAPTVTASPSPVSLAYQTNGATGATNSASQTLTLTNPGTQDLNFNVFPFSSTTPAWLAVNPNQGTIPANGSVQVTVSYATSANLAANSYQGTLEIFASGAANSPITVSVNLLVSNQPLLNLPETPLTFTYQMGAQTPAAQNVLATTTAASGQMTLVLSETTASGGNWLSVPQTAQTGTAFAVSVNASVVSGLQPGSYTGTISVVGYGSANAGSSSSALTIPVTLKVTNDPLVSATFGGCTQGLVNGLKCPMSFAYETGQNNPTSVTVTVASSTGAALTITPTVTMNSQTACGTNWLTVGQVASGANNTSTFTVSVNPTSPAIANGTTCNGTLSIAAVNPADSDSAPNSPVQIPVALYVNNSGMLVANPISLNFSVALNAQSTAQTLSINSTGTASGDQLAFTVSANAAWLEVFPTTGNTSPNNAITVAVNSTGLQPGTYTGQITITATASGVLDSPLMVPVTMTVAGPTMTVTPTGTLSFTQALGTAAPQPKQLTVATSGTDIAFTAGVVMQQQASVGWLTATPTSGTATSANAAQVQVAVNGSNLPAGTYNGSVTITATSTGVQNSPVTIPVTFVVSPGTLSVNQTSLTFNAAQGSASQSQPVKVSGTPGALSFTATTSSTAPWLSVSAASGTTPATLQITANPAGLQPAQYTGQVTITANGAAGSPQTINVTLNVTQAQTFSVSPSTLNFSYVIGTQTTPQAQTAQLTASGGTASFTASSDSLWLQVSPTTGSTPATLTVSIVPGGVTAGNYTGKISINSPASATTPAATITVNLTVAAVPAPVISALENAASAVVGNGVAPGENIVIYGTGVGPATLTFGGVTNGTLATIAGGTQVLFDGRPAPVYYASASQTSVFVPYEVGGQATTKMQVVYQGVPSQTITYNVVSTAPGIYTMNASGSGPAVAWNYDTNSNYTGINAQVPAVKGGVVSLYITGDGATSGPVLIDGLQVTTLFNPVAQVTATVGGAAATVKYAGSAPGSFYGVTQVNVLIPAGAPSGASVPLVINVGGNNSQSNVTLSIQ